MTCWSLPTACQNCSRESWRAKGKTRLSSSLPSGSTTRAPPLCSVSSTPKTTPSTLTSACRPSRARVSYYTETSDSVYDNHTLHYQPSNLTYPLLSFLSSVFCSISLPSISSYHPLPDWEQIWWDQFKPCPPGRRPSSSCDAACQGSTAWSTSPQHLRRLQTSPHSGGASDCVRVPPTWSEHGST